MKESETRGVRRVGKEKDGFPNPGSTDKSAKRMVDGGEDQDDFGEILGLSGNAARTPPSG